MVITIKEGEAACKAILKKTKVILLMPISKKELIKQLKSLKGIRDKEDAHGKADDLLIQYINDPAVTAAYDDVEKWYA